MVVDAAVERFRWGRIGLAGGAPVAVDGGVGGVLVGGRVVRVEAVEELVGGVEAGPGGVVGHVGGGEDGGPCGGDLVAEGVAELVADKDAAWG